MIKVWNQYVPGRLFVLLLTENLLILAGVWMAVTIYVRQPQFSLFSEPVFFAKALLITVVCQVCFYYADLYDLRSLGSRAQLLVRLLNGLGAASLLLAFLLALFPEARMGTGVIETSLCAIIFLILSWRVLIGWLNRAYVAGERILLVGAGESIQNLAREIGLRTDLPVKLLGSVTEGGSHSHPLAGLDLPCLGSLDEIGAIVAEQRPDRVVIGLKERRRALPIQQLLRLRIGGLKIEEASTLYEKMAGRIPVESILPSSLIFADGFRHSRKLRFYERAFGLVAASLSLVALAPLMILIAFIIKMDSKGPALYRQKRVGLNGAEFDVLKFRSMRQDAESNSGPVWARERDPRITRVGAILRKLRFDELPQFINILKGEMSFVGPRPERPYFVERLREQIPFYDIRHSVRPGITGWAQVRSRYSASVEDSKEKLEFDLFYIKNVSLSMDVLIIFQTVKIVLFGRGAR